MAVKKNPSKTVDAATKKRNRKFINMADAVGLEFTPEGGIWLNNGTYSPRLSIDIDSEKKETLSGFTRHITLVGCKCVVAENPNGYAELVIRPDIDTDADESPF